MGHKHTEATKEKLKQAQLGKHPTEETRKKLSESCNGSKNCNFGKTLSEETKKKISDALSGERNPNYGKPSPKSQETRAKISEAQQGRRHSPETIAKRAVTLIGRKVSKETRAKISAALCGEKNPRFGKHQSKEVIEKRSDALRGVKRPSPSLETRSKISASLCREKSPRWQGGISFEPYCPKFNKNLKTRVRTFFKNECAICGRSKRENKQNLCVHHVEYNKAACCDGKPVQFAACCRKCHSRTNSDKERWESMLHRIIEEIWGGRSYFTKDEWICLSIEAKQ